MSARDERPCVLCKHDTTKPAPSWWPVPDQYVCSKCTYEHEGFKAMARCYCPGKRLPTEDPASDWPPFQDATELCSVPSMKRDMLPNSLAPFVCDQSEMMDLPLEFFAVPMLVAASSLLGSRVVALPQARGDWWQPSVLWGTVIGRPSIKKTPSESKALGPFYRVVKEAREGHSGEGDPPRYVVRDATVEKLIEIMTTVDDGRALLLHSPELAHLFATFTKKGRESDRVFYVSLWDLRNEVMQDRIGRGTIRAHCGLAIYGSIQPGVLAKHIKAAMSNGTGADGLLQRFSLAVYPDVPRTLNLVDREQDRHARQLAIDAFRRLASLDAESLGATTHEWCPFPGLRFDADAQPVFDDWYYNLELRIRRDDEGHSAAFGAHLGKYGGLVPSLALLLHVLDHEGGKSDGIDRVSLDRALAMVAYLEEHAKRIYGEGPRQAGTAMIEQIRAGEIEDGMTLREVYRAQRSGLRTAAEAQAGAKHVERMGWLRLERQGGKRVVRLRPDLASYLTSARTT